MDFRPSGVRNLLMAKHATIKVERVSCAVLKFTTAIKPTDIVFCFVETSFKIKGNK